MKPVIEDTKIDKITQENFESLRDVLCGNVSLDNMSIRILEGITKESDTENLVIHSGNSRPVGWFPLVGDVYVQEISEKYVDVRSTKPEVSFKILLVFGPAITNESLKVIGGPSYANTETTIVNNIEKYETVIEAPTVVEPIQTVSSTLGVCTTLGVIQKVGTDGDYFYFTVEGSADRLHRLNRTTGAYDNLQLVGATKLGVATFHSGLLYISDTAQSGGLNPLKVWSINLTTFAVDTTYNWANANNGQLADIADIYVDDTYFYLVGHHTLTTTKPRITRYKKSDGSFAYINLAITTDATTELRGIRIFMDTLYAINTFIIPVMNTKKDTIEVAQFAKDGAWNRTLGAAELTSSPQGRWYFRNAEYVGTSVYMPVCYDTGVTGASTQIYSQGILKYGALSKSFEFIPMSGYFEHRTWITNLVQQDDYLYMISAMAQPGYCSVLRYDTFDDTYAIGVALFVVTWNANARTLPCVTNCTLCVDTDGSILLTYLGDTTYRRNASYAKLSWADLSETT